jgi:hypothetical protein
MRHCKSLPVKLLLICVMIVGTAVLTLIPMAAHARAIKVTLSCPQTVTPGDIIQLGLTLENTSSNSKAIAKSAIAAHLGHMTIIGPYSIPLSLTLSPNETVSIPNYLVVPFPSAPSTTFSSLGVSLLDSANKPIAEGWCNIEIP